MSTTSLRTILVLAVIAALGSGLVSGCGATVAYIPGTNVVSSPENQQIVDRLEDYRMAVERKDIAQLVLMASKRYWDDAGTPSGTDDFGYQGLQQILTGRFQKVKSIRYSMKYMDIDRRGDRATVDVLIDASFSIKDARGSLVRSDMRDQNQFTLEWNGKQWLFLSGM